MNQPSDLRVLASFVTCVPAPGPGTSVAVVLDRVARRYAFGALWLAAAGNLVVGLAAVVLRPFGAPPMVEVAALITVFYLVRGVRLIDGFADLSEGLWLGLGRRAPRDAVWAAIRSPANGAYGILSVGLVIIWQVALYLTLVALPSARMLTVLTVAGACGPLAVVAAHTGGNRYRLDSAFHGFGASLGRPIALALALPAIAFAGWAIHWAAWTPAPAARMAAAQILGAVAAGVATRALTLRAAGAFNGDVIGFCTLAGEMVAVAAALAAAGGI